MSCRVCSRPLEPGRVSPALPALFALALAALLVILTATPALAATTTRETGTLECDFDKDVHTRVRAKGDHRHERVGVQIIEVDLPDDGLFRTGTVDWSIWAMQWATGNQVQREYDYVQSYAYCGL